MYKKVKVKVKVMSLIDYPTFLTGTDYNMSPTKMKVMA